MNSSLGVSPPQAPQQGYILIFVAVILLALISLSVSFFSGSITSNKIAGYNRDAEESFMLCESALNLVYGGFIFQGDFNQDQKVDNEQTINLDNPLPLPNPYMYIVSDNGKIEQTTPSILQRVADGEARAVSGTVNSASISPTSTSLMINDLFSNSVKPILFIQDSNGIQQTTGNWNSVPNSPGKAAVWIEVIRDSVQPNKLYLFVQSAAQVGKSKSYIQRYIGGYSDILGGQVNALTESNPAPSMP